MAAGENKIPERLINFRVYNERFPGLASRAKWKAP